MKGHVYVITQAAFEEWVKIGLTTKEPATRLSQYQTGCPFRDYELHFAAEVDDCRAVEALVHDSCADMGLDIRNEWVRCPVALAVSMVSTSVSDFE